MRFIGIRNVYFDFMSHDLKMADESRLCFLSKFQQNIQISSINRVFPCLRHQILAILLSNDVVHLVDIRSNKRRRFESGDECSKIKNEKRECAFSLEAKK